jgi:hypothetical protein
MRLVKDLRPPVVIPSPRILVMKNPTVRLVLISLRKLANVIRKNP